MIELELKFAWQFVPAIYKRLYLHLSNAGPLTSVELQSWYPGHPRQVTKALTILHKAQLCRIVEWKRDPLVFQRQIPYWNIGQGKHAPKLRKMTCAEKARRWRAKVKLTTTKPSLPSLLKGQLS
jgi:hypothetical protein